MNIKIYSYKGIQSFRYMEYRSIQLYRYIDFIL